MQFSVLKYDIVDNEIEEVVDYYQNISVSLGKRFRDEVFKALHDLENSVHHYLILADKKHRRKQISGFPYMLVYSIEANNIVLVKMLFPQKSSPDKVLKRIG